jgi:hypothetical protein
MANTKTTPDETANADASRKRVFEYQLDILKVEIDVINQTIARFDEHTRATRNWAIVTWAGSIAISLGNQDLRKYIILTAILPIVFWFVDARWTNLIRAFLYRMNKISEFLNDDRFVRSVEQQRLIDFTLLDPRGKQYKKTLEYKKSVNFLRAALKYAEVSIFYLGLTLISIGLGSFFLLVP